MNRLLLNSGNHIIAAGRSLSIEVIQEAEPYDLLPHSSDSEWACFRPGGHSWNIEHGGLYTVEGEEGIVTEMVQDEDTAFSASVLIPGATLAGTVHLQDIGIEAPHRAIAKLSVSLLGDDLPTLTRKS